MTDPSPTDLPRPPHKTTGNRRQRENRGIYWMAAGVEVEDCIDCWTSSYCPELILVVSKERL
jgi:hypothetical protein